MWLPNKVRELATQITARGLSSVSYAIKKTSNGAISCAEDFVYLIPEWDRSSISLWGADGKETRALALS